MLLTLLSLVSGCVIIPVPEKCISGEEITDNELASLKPGTTSKAEIVEMLGKPDVLWIDENIFAYNWKTVWALMPWIVAGGYQAYGGIEELTKDYVLLIQFDHQNRMTRFKVVKRSMFKTYGDLLKNWAEQDDGTSSDNSSVEK